MKNLIAELLIRLADKEEEAKELTAQVDALNIVVTALLRQMDEQQFDNIKQSIVAAMPAQSGFVSQHSHEVMMLESCINRLLSRPGC